MGKKLQKIRTNIWQHLAQIRRLSRGRALGALRAGRGPAGPRRAGAARPGGAAPRGARRAARPRGAP